MQELTIEKGVETEKAKSKVYLFLGALGSGKTTLINNLSQNFPENTLVIINDVWSINIDVSRINWLDTIPLQNWCICCDDTNSLEDVLQKIKEDERQWTIRNIIIEPSGIAGWTNIKKILNRNWFETKTITLVDENHFEQRTDLEKRVNENQVKVADIIWKTWNNWENTESVENWIKDIAPWIEIVDIPTWDDKEKFRWLWEKLSEPTKENISNTRKTVFKILDNTHTHNTLSTHSYETDISKFKLEEIINILWDNLIRAKWVLAWGQEFNYVHWSLNFWEFTDKSGHFNLITSTDFDENILWLNLKEKNMETNNYNLSEMLDFSKSEEKVNILLRQYNERNEMNFELENLNNSLKNAKTEQERQDISEKITKLKFTQDKLWDDMKYDNPYIWVEYKIQAYAWWAGEIKTINDFRTHCNKPDYICGKRLDFLNKYLKEKYDLDIMDDNSVDWNEYLSEFLENWIIKELSQNKEFMEKWLSYEYFMRGDEVAKWKNYVKN